MVNISGSMFYDSALNLVKLGSGEGKGKDQQQTSVISECENLVTRTSGSKLPRTRHSSLKVEGANMGVVPLPCNTI